MSGPRYRATLAVMRADDTRAEDRFFDHVEYAGSFLMGKSELHVALRKLIRTLDDEKIPYAIIGALALGEYGYRRTTEDIDILLSPSGLAAFKTAHLGRGYVEKFAGSKGLRDAEHGVPIDVVLTGEYPGDGKPKPIVFPDPATAQPRNGVSLLPLERLLELKLASGMTAPHRLRDLADVLEVIRVRRLDREFADQLAPYVRAKYDELWEAAQGGLDE